MEASTTAKGVSSRSAAATPLGARSRSSVSPPQSGHVPISLAGGDEARGSGAVRIDQGEGGDVDREEVERLVRDEASDRLGVTGSREIRESRSPASGR